MYDCVIRVSTDCLWLASNLHYGERVCNTVSKCDVTQQTCICFILLAPYYLLVEIKIYQAFLLHQYIAKLDCCNRLGTRLLLSCCSAACLGTCSWELHVVTLCIGSNYKVRLKNRASEIWYCLNLLLSSHLSAHTEVGYILCFANHTALGMNVHISLKKKKPAWISCKVNHYTGCISFQTRHHRVHWDDW